MEEKVRKDAQVRKDRIERYTWVMKERLRPETITEIQIHRNTNPAIVTVSGDLTKEYLMFTNHSSFLNLASLNWMNFDLSLPRSKTL